jgi:hypothetical protein
LLTVVQGAKTRLARTFLTASPERLGEVALVARDSAEAEWASSSYPRALIAPASSPSFPSGHDKVRVVCCALGPVHPGNEAPFEDMEAALRDLRVVSSILSDHRRADVHVLFISSVLALAPRRDRHYYAGFKCLSEGALSAMIRERENATLSVLYPGRCVERKPSYPGLKHLYTTYGALAEKMLSVLESGERRAIIGMDARLWLALRGFGRSREALAASLGA